MDVLTTAQLDWANQPLPDAWPDQLKWGAPKDMLRLLQHVKGKRQRVQLPDDLPGKEIVPKYMLQEFHHLPNGYYSKHITAGYVRWFDRVMLGELRRARSLQAAMLCNSQRALDLGCGGGHTGAMIYAAGVPEVWGLDPSAYLLQQAAREFPFLKLALGTAEATPFSHHFFQGVAVCFLFHELPPRFCDQALTEIHRILAPGGTLCIAEPSPIQMQLSTINLWRLHGWKGLYFKRLAHRVFEPFVAAWHQRDIDTWLQDHGFTLQTDHPGMPIRHIVATRN